MGETFPTGLAGLTCFRVHARSSPQRDQTVLDPAQLGYGTKVALSRRVWCNNHMTTDTKAAGPTPPYLALTIAKWFVAWAEANEAELSNLKLQKLLYYAQGYHLALRNVAGDQFALSETRVQFLYAAAASLSGVAHSDGGTEGAEGARDEAGEERDVGLRRARDEPGGGRRRLGSAV